MTPDELKRFLAKVDRRGESECWVWTASTNRGYGQFKARRPDGSWTTKSAHKLAYEHFKGPVPKGLFVLHDCPSGDNPACVNPYHLWVGNQKENIEDCIRKGRFRKPTRGEASPSAKLSQQDVCALRRLLANGVTQREAARRFGVSQAQVWRIKEGLRWSL